jgi:hypothetical protein
MRMAELDIARRGVCLLLAFAFAPASVLAGDIHKCVTQGDVSYQSAPCPAGTDASTIIRAEAPRVADVTPPRPPPPEIQKNPGPQYAYGPRSSGPMTAVITSSVAPERPRLPLGTRPLQIGIRDDEVLNLPNWGRPLQISRNKANGVWREDWLYAASRGHDATTLHFTNGKLSGIETEPIIVSSYQDPTAR